MTLYLVLLASCAGTDESAETWRTERVESEGALCIRSLGGGEAESPLEVIAVLFSCLSTGCSRSPEAACAVTLDEGTLYVESTGAVDVKGGDCHDDCQALLAKCVSPPLAAGTYTVVYGSSSALIALPTTGSAPFGSPEIGCAFP